MPPQAFLFTGSIEETTPGSLVLDLLVQNHAVLVDTPWVFPGHISGAHMEEQQGNHLRSGWASAFSPWCPSGLWAPSMDQTFLGSMPGWKVIDSTLCIRESPTSSSAPLLSLCTTVKKNGEVTVDPEESFSNVYGSICPTSIPEKSIKSIIKY